MEREKIEKIDRELREAVEQMRNGEEEGFAVLYRRTYRYVYSKAKFLMGEEEEALDLMQEVYLAAYKNIGTLKNINSVYAWLGAITLRQSSNLNRRKRHNVLLPEAEEELFTKIPDSEERIEDRMAKEGEVQAIRKCIGSLSQEQKEVVLAYYYDERKVSEIADLLDVSEGTVKSRLYLARKHLKDSLTEVEKKQGYKFYSVSAAAVAAAIGALFSDNSITAQAARGVYADLCARAGIRAAHLKEITAALGSETGGEARTMPGGSEAADVPYSAGTAVTEGVKAGMVGAAKVSAKAGSTKALLIAAGILGAVAAAGITGAVWYGAVQKAEEVEAIAEQKKEETKLAQEEKEAQEGQGKEQEESNTEAKQERETQDETSQVQQEDTQANTPSVPELAAQYYDDFLIYYRDEEAGGFSRRDLELINPIFWDTLRFPGGYAQSGMEIYYTVIDLANDGEPELFISDGQTIYGVYGTMHGVGQIMIILLGDGSAYLGERLQCDICENNMLKVIGSGGAYANGIEYYQLGMYSYEPACVEAIVQDGDNYYFATVRDNGLEKELVWQANATAEDYQYMSNKYPLKQDIEWYKLSEYGR